MSKHVLHSAFYLTVFFLFFFFLVPTTLVSTIYFCFWAPILLIWGWGAVLLYDRYRKQPLPAELLVRREHSWVPSDVVHKVEEPKRSGRKGSAWHCVVPGEGQEGFLKGGDF